MPLHDGKAQHVKWRLENQNYQPADLLIGRKQYGEPVSPDQHNRTRASAWKGVEHAADLISSGMPPSGLTYEYYTSYPWSVLPTSEVPVYFVDSVKTSMCFLHSVS